MFGPRLPRILDIDYLCPLNVLILVGDEKLHWICWIYFDSENTYKINN